jgi:hypothetical protein
MSKAGLEKAALGRHIIASMMMKLKLGERSRNLTNSLDLAYSVARKAILRHVGL